MKKLNEIYQQNLETYKQTGERQHPSQLLAMRLLPKKDTFLTYDTVGRLYDIYKKEINTEIAQVVTDFEFTSEDLQQYITENINVDENEMIWFPFYNGLWALQQAITKFPKSTPEQIYYRFFNHDVSENEITHHKLVRDHVISKIEARGDIALYSVLSKEEYWYALLAKDKEELEEVKKANSSQQILEELSDKLEVIRAMAMFHGFQLEDVLLTAEQKREENGAFTKRLYLEKTISSKK